MLDMVSDTEIFILLEHELDDKHCESEHHSTYQWGHADGDKFWYVIRHEPCNNGRGAMVICDGYIQDMKEHMSRVQGYFLCQDCGLIIRTTDFLRILGPA